MATKRKSRADEESPTASARKQQRRGQSGRLEQRRTPRKRSDQLLEIMKPYRSHSNGCRGCHKILCECLWYWDLASTADDPDSELEMAVGIMQGPWTLTPWDIVRQLKGVAIEDIKWTVRFLWNCHEKYRAKELPWRTVHKLLIDAIEETGIGRKFTREASEKLQEKLLEEFAKKETTRDSSPSPTSGAADDVEQTPVGRSTTSANEQATPTSSSSQLVGRARNITSPPPVRTAAPRPSATSADNPPGSPGRSDLPSVQPPSRPPVQRDPLGRRDGFNASVHCATPLQIDTAPSDPPRTTGQAEETQHQSLIDLASSGDSTAPSQTEEDTQLRHDAMVENLNSSSALSTQTLSHILYTFLPTQKIVISEDGSPDLLPVRVLDLCTLLHPSSSEQAESQETLTWNGTNSFSCDSRDIEAWPHYKLDRDGITTFVLPFTDSSTNDSVVYILFVREKICLVHFFADMLGNNMLRRTIPLKLIETVADSGDSISWRKIELQPHTEDLSWLNSGLRVFERCLHYTFSPQRNERDVVATDDEISFLRAALATFFDDPTKVVQFERWLSGEWSFQRTITLRGKTGAQVPIPNTEHAAFRYLPRYLQSCEDLDRVRQRQSRLADALNYHIPNLEALLKLAVERLDNWLGELKAQQDTAKAKTEKDLEEFYQKMILMHKGLFIGKDKEFYEARARDHMGLLKPKTYEELERNLRQLQTQESDAQNRKESYLQFQNVLQTARVFAQREKVTEDDKVSKAETREAQLYLEEWDAFTKEQEERAQARDFMLSLAPPTTLAGNQNRVNKEGDRVTQQPQSRPQPSDSTADANLHDSPQSDKSGEVASLGEAMHATEASSKNSDPPAPRDAGYRLQTRQSTRESEAATLLHRFQKRNSVSTAGVQGSGESTDAPGDDLDLV